jgi:membrane protease YdiL (CAAX protease family)
VPAEAEPRPASATPAPASEPDALDDTLRRALADGLDDPLPDDHLAASAATAGPPGGSIFTLEGRRAPGLYLMAWLLTGVGLVLLLLIGPMASAEGARLLLITTGAVLTTLGLATACGYQVLERGARLTERYRGPSPVLVFFTYLMAFVVIGTVVFASGVLDPEVPFGFLVVGALQAVGYAVLVWLVVVRTNALQWPQMGWWTWQGDHPRNLLRAVGEAAAIMLPTTFALVVAGGILALLLDVEAPGVVPTASNSLEAFAIVLGAAVIIPVGEELFFRGFALTAWLRDLGPRSALIRSSLFFALIHIANIDADSFSEGAAQALLQTAVILPVGLVLGWLFLRRGMTAAIAGHVTYNGLLLFLSLLATRLPQAT